MISDIINERAKDFNQEIKGLERDFLRQIRSSLKEFDVKGGRLENNDFNRKLAVRFRTEIDKALKGAGYQNEVSKFLEAMNPVQAETIKQQKRNGINVAASLLNPAKQTVTDLLLGSLEGAGIEAAVSDPIRKVITNTVLTGGNLIDMIGQIEDAIISDSQRLGIMTRYVTQISRDALYQFSGLANQVIATEYDLNAYEYVGSLVDDSRPQCQRWVEKQILLFSELQDEIAWAERNGKGMIPATTPQNFAIYRGGYNCQHEAIPVKK